MSKIVYQELGTSSDITQFQKRYAKVKQFLVDEDSNLHWKVQKANVLKLLHPQPGDTFLDIGCGSGKYEVAISKITHVTGLDISEEKLELARALVKEFGNPEKASFRLFEPPLKAMFPAEKFNKIFMVDSSEHMPPDVFRDFLADIKELLTDDGCLLIYTPNRSHFLEKIKPISVSGHINLTTMKEMIAELNQKGYAVKEHYYECSHIPGLRFFEEKVPFPLFKRRLCVKAQPQRA